MKNKRKLIKRILQVDLSIQVILIALTLILMIFPYTEWSSFMTFYFGLGGFQLLSYIFHFYRRVKKNELSQTYSYTLAAIVIFGSISLLSGPVAFTFLFLMLFLGILMALCYLYHTYNNLKTYQDEK